jgi:hypothetical protein
VIEQNPIADAHLVPHEVPRLVVAYAGPGKSAIAGKVIDAGFVWF